MIKLSFILSFVLALVFACSLVAASAYELELSQVKDKIVEKHKISLNEEKTLVIPLHSDVSSISSKTNYSLEDNKITLIGKEAEFNFVTGSDMESTDEGYLFIKTVRFYSDFDNFTVKLILDEGYFTDKEFLFPKPSSITTDGHQIILIWELQNVKEKDSIPIFVKILSPPPSKLIIIFFWTIVFLSAAIVVSWIFFKKRKPERPTHQQKSTSVKTDKFEGIERYLVESEKIILGKIKGADRGEMWQKQLQIATGFSKAKLSRLVRNLESRHLVEKIPFGNTNKIRLK